MGKDLKGKEIGKGVDQRADGQYRWRYTAPDGSRPMVIERTLSALLEQKKAIEAELTAGTWVDPKRTKITLDDWFAIWIHGHTAKPTTRLFYVQYFRTHIRPYLGQLALRDLTPYRVSRWLGELSQAGHSPAVRKHAHRTLSACLGVKGAEGDGRLPRGNPCRLARCPTPPKPDWRKIDYDEFEHLISGMDEFDQGMVTILWVMALRFGEVTALRQMDVNLLHRALSVEVGTYSLGKDEEFGIEREQLMQTPKGNRKRVIPWIPERALRVLTAQLELPGGPEDLVFPSRKGKVINHSVWHERVWTPAVKKSGLAPLRPHDLRHSAASWLTEQGMDIGTLQLVLGHESQATTQLYIHRSSEQVRYQLQRAWGEQPDQTAAS